MKNLSFFGREEKREREERRGERKRERERERERERNGDDGVPTLVLALAALGLRALRPSFVQALPRAVFLFLFLSTCRLSFVRRVVCEREEAR